MTLILTELSTAGIAMAADSAISKMINGNIVAKDMQYWQKILKVPRICGAVSYWGDIGLVHKYRFDHWLQKKLLEAFTMICLHLQTISLKN